jgi:alpha-methylacyl-CoA racemase
MSPLRGVRVLDLTRLLPGPFASLVLADLGATVDRLEDPQGGDYLRLMPPSLHGTGAAFHVLNRGKRSLVLDLKHDQGKAAFLRLVTHYDVVCEQFRPGVLDRLGIGASLQLAHNPRLILCSLSGYGQNGPLRDRAGHDLNYLARAGLLGLQGPEEAVPQVPAFQVADVGGGLWSVIAILAALRERDRTGRGRTLDVAMTDGVLPFASLALARLLGGELPERGGETLSGGIAAYNVYRTQDGEFVSLAALEPKFLARFCAGVGEPFDPDALVPGPHQGDLKRRYAALFASRTRSEWEQFGRDHDCCVEPVLRPGELLADDQLSARRLFGEVDREGTRAPQLRTPVSPHALPEPAVAPYPGQHTDAILCEAGFTRDEIDRLRELGVVNPV